MRIVMSENSGNPETPCGRKIGGWNILRSLGSGGMAEVFEVEDARLGARVAIKLFSCGKDDDGRLRERFLAELKEALVANVAGEDDWGEHWKAAVNAIHRFGRYREEEALDSMDPMTREVVKRLGYQDLCRSENQMADRANFRVVFEQVANNERNKAALPKDLQERIALIGSEAKQLEGSHDEIPDL